MPYCVVLCISFTLVLTVADRETSSMPFLGKWPQAVGKGSGLSMKQSRDQQQIPVRTRER